MMTSQPTMTSSCRSTLPWNMPKDPPTPVAMSTYAVLMFGLSNGMMAFLGGLTHQFLQTVEPYTGDADVLRTWLLVWREAASFSAWICLSLLVMTEQLIVQECLLRIPRKIRIIYYVIIFCACIAFFCYNFVPLSGEYEDPFSVGKSFVVSFVVMLVYGIATVAVLIHHCCCHSRDTRSCSTDNDVQYSPAYSVDNKRTDKKPYSREIYSYCKTMATHCNNNNDYDVASRRWELILIVISPWMYIAAGASNHFLKNKCSDSDNAFEELGCLLPDYFNHNAAMHVVQIFSIIGFFIAEHLSMTRRRNLWNNRIRRITTSSTSYNDVNNSCTIAISETKVVESVEKLTMTEYTNNNKPSYDDVICDMTSDNETHIGGDVTSNPSIGEDIFEEPEFPTFLKDDDTGNRHSMYDNLSSSQSEVP